MNSNIDNSTPWAIDIFRASHSPEAFWYIVNPLIYKSAIDFFTSYGITDLPLALFQRETSAVDTNDLTKVFINSEIALKQIPFQYVHEVGHIFECKYKLVDLNIDYLKRRSIDQQIRLCKLDLDDNFYSTDYVTEWGIEFKEQTFDNYSRKVYFETFDINRICFTEVLSTGLSWLYYYGKEFRKKDKKHYAITMKAIKLIKDSYV